MRLMRKHEELKQDSNSTSDFDSTRVHTLPQWRTINIIKISVRLHSDVPSERCSWFFDVFMFWRTSTGITKKIYSPFYVRSTSLETRCVNFLSRGSFVQKSNPTVELWITRTSSWSSYCLSIKNNEIEYHLMIYPLWTNPFSIWAEVNWIIIVLKARDFFSLRQGSFCNKSTKTITQYSSSFWWGGIPIKYFFVVSWRLKT